jgi:hypothetical protein
MVDMQKKQLCVYKLSGKHTQFFYEGDPLHRNVIILSPPLAKFDTNGIN